MDDLFRHVARLNLIYELPIAQEKFSLNTHLKDFGRYYFGRFVTNLTHVFSDFSQSEIADFNQKHQSKIAHLTKYPALNLDKTIIPIPKGMVKSYNQTLSDLLKILDPVSPQTLKSDLESLLSAMGNNTIRSLTVSPYSKKQFDDAKHAIGKLFGKTGLTHVTASYGLGSLNEIKDTNKHITTTVSRYYPDIVALNPLLKRIEDTHQNLTWSDADRILLTKHLMMTAYRLSIFAVVMDHVQDIEHGFVKSLGAILNIME